jgi:GT2 family glycosyltransferase
VIPNLNCAILGKTLAALCSQKHEVEPSVEIFVVGRDDLGHVKNFPQVHFIETPNPVGPAIARNIAIRKSQGDLIICVDADCIVQPNWLQEMIAAHYSPNKAIIGGAIKIDNDNPWALADNLSSFHDYLPNLPASIYSVLPTCNLSIRRGVIDKVGLFDENLLINEDVDWTMRARRLGYKLYFNPSAIVWHRPQRKNFRAIWRHGYDWGYHSIVNRWRYHDLEALPFVLHHRWVIGGFSPLIALAVTTKIYIENRFTWKYLLVSPIVLLSKIAWCLGAARRLRDLQSKRGNYVG